MGSQRVAKISSGRSRIIRMSMSAVRLTDVPGILDVSPRVAANAIGPISKSSAFIQCLSSASTQAGVDALIGFAEQLKFGDKPADEVLQDHGVDKSIRRPAAKFIEMAIEKLREDLAAQSRSTESAIAVEDALPKSVIDLLRVYLPKAEAMTADRTQFIEVFRKADARKIENTVMHHVISSLIDRILDAARGDELGRKAAKAKRKISEDFVPKFNKKIDQLAREKGIPPSQVPKHIPEWADELESFISKYRD